jgi:hypothetical protein
MVDLYLVFRLSVTANELNFIHKSLQAYLLSIHHCYPF